MTSRNLLCNMLKEDMKRRLWAIAIAILLFLFALPIYLATALEQTRRYAMDVITAIDKHKMLIANAKRCLGIWNSPVQIITILLAVICAISGFYYLHSRKKVDFYHSIPVKREVLFASTYILGILIYIVPYALSILVSFIIASANGALDASVVGVAWKAFGINLLNYSITYTVAIIAVLLTGQFIVSILAGAVFFVYGPMVAALLHSLCSSYFDTFYYNQGIASTFIYKLSPISMYVSMFTAMNKGMLRASTVLIYIAVLIILSGLAVLLYKKRPSEVATKAIAYKKLQPIIKTLISVPVGLVAGIVFVGLTNSNTDFWLIFGMVCGYLLCSCIMEIIYNFDFKAAFKNRIQVLCGAVLMFAVFACFKWDLINYDTYIPARDKIESMSIVMPNIDTDGDRRFIVEDYDGYHFEYLDTTEYAFKYMKLKDTDLAYEIAKKAIAEYATDEELEETNSCDDYMPLAIRYRLTSGRNVKRYYQIPWDSFFDSLSQIYATREYKEGTLPIYRMNKINEVTCNSIFQSLTFTLTSEENMQVYNLYLEELASLSLKDMRDTAPIAEICFTDDNLEYSHYIYPSFTKTIAFLTEHGFDFTKTFDVNKITGLTVEYSIPYEGRDEEQYLEYASKYKEWNFILTTEYTDKDKINAILPYLVDEKYVWNNGNIEEYDTNLAINLSMKTDDYGNVKNMCFYMDKDKIPDFVKKDVLYWEEKK